MRERETERECVREISHKCRCDANTYVSIRIWNHFRNQTVVIKLYTHRVVSRRGEEDADQGRRGAEEVAPRGLHRRVYSLILDTNIHTVSSPPTPLRKVLKDCLIQHVINTTEKALPQIPQPPFANPPPIALDLHSLLLLLVHCVSLE